MSTLNMRPHELRSKRSELLKTLQSFHNKRSKGIAMEPSEKTKWSKTWAQFEKINDLAPLSAHVKNLNNTCYISSILHSLIGVLYSFRYILNDDPSMIGNIIKKMRFPNNTSESLVKEDGAYFKFVSYIRKNIANGSDMFDADELLMSLLNESKHIQKICALKMYIANVDSSGNTINDPQEQTIMQYQVIMTCNVNCLETYFRKNRVRIDRLEQTKDDLGETLHKDVRQVTLHELKANSVLIVHMQRFVFDPQTKQILKMQNHITYPLLFHGNLIDQKCDHLYELCAVVEHYGLAACGHYVCIVKYGKTWWKYDDLLSEPTIVSEKNMCRGLAYLLFYRKRI